MPLGAQSAWSVNIVLRALMYLTCTWSVLLTCCALSWPALVNRTHSVHPAVDLGGTHHSLFTTMFQRVFFAFAIEHVFIRFALSIRAISGICVILAVGTQCFFVCKKAEL